MDELAGHGAIRAVFEDLGGYGALASQQGEGGEAKGTESRETHRAHPHRLPVMLPGTTHWSYSASVR